jgi:hypothetical protein
VVWHPGETEIRFTVQNQYNAIDLSACTLRTQQNAGGKWMTMIRAFRDVPLSCPPGESCEVRIPIWNSGLLATLEKGGFGLCRCSLLAPDGFRPVTVDILVVQPTVAADAADAAMPIGPDAVL